MMYSFSRMPRRTGIGTRPIGMVTIASGVSLTASATAAIVCSDSAWPISLSFDGSQVDTTSTRRWRSAKSTGRSWPRRPFPVASQIRPRTSWSPVATWATTLDADHPSHKVPLAQPPAESASTACRYQLPAWASRLGCPSIAITLPWPRAPERPGCSQIRVALDPTLPLMGSPYRYSWPPPCVLRSVSQVQLFVGDKEAWDGPFAIRVGRRIDHGLGGRRIHSEPAGAGRARYRVRGTGGGRSDPYQRRARHRDRSTGPRLRQWADGHGHTTKHMVRLGR